MRPRSIPSASRSEAKANSPRTLGVPSGRGGLSPQPARQARRRAGLDVGHDAGPPDDDTGDGLEDAAVAGAAAEVAGQRLPDLELVGVGLPLEQVVDGDDEAGRAEPALHGAGVDQGLLHVGEQLAVAGRAEALDGGDLAADGAGGQLEAGAHQLAVDEHRARAALALLAGVLGAGQAEAVAEHVAAGSRSATASSTARSSPFTRSRVGVAQRLPSSGERPSSSARRASTPTAWRR